MTDETFVIRAYGKSELAMMYLPKHSQKAALKLLRYWLSINPRLRYIIKKKGNFYTPKDVAKIVEEIGEPFDIE